MGGHLGLTTRLSDKYLPPTKISILIEATQTTKEWFCSIKIQCNVLCIIFVAYSELNRVGIHEYEYLSCMRDL